MFDSDLLLAAAGRIVLLHFIFNPAAISCPTLRLLHALINVSSPGNNIEPASPVDQVRVSEVLTPPNPPEFRLAVLRQVDAALLSPAGSHFCSWGVLMRTNPGFSILGDTVI
ncbi:hypothetical protein NQZ68_031954 [Dissostichus eleginoides]|nr:hypothetical protein NQZ68_031954 [Dissostichus eleginoides]